MHPHSERSVPTLSCYEVFFPLDWAPEEIRRWAEDRYAQLHNWEIINLGRGRYSGRDSYSLRRWVWIGFESPWPLQRNLR